MPSDHDLRILRALAERKVHIAALPIQKERWALWSRLNDLEPVRPLIWINEVCWHEIEREDPGLPPRCQDPFLREVESDIRRELYQWDHFPVDSIVTAEVAVPIVVRDTGFGLVERSRRIHASPGSVASRQFEPVICAPEDIDLIRPPEVTVDRAETDRRLEAAQAAVGDILPVRRRGVPGRWFAPWDLLVTWWGVEPALMDLILRPDMVHRAVDRLVDAHLSRLDQWEALGLLETNNLNIRVGSGGYGCTKDLPPAGGEPSRATDLWGCATAQVFSQVSPEMHAEFALRYERRWLDRFGLSYYGCCEPLHEKIDILRDIPNLRKISASPWADLSAFSAAVGRDYVVSFKPNPNLLAEDRFDEGAVRRHLRFALARLQGCAVEVILKDISTIRFDPSRLARWADIACEEASRAA